MAKIKSFFADFISVFPLKKSIIILSVSCAIVAAMELTAYFIIFKWDRTIERDSLSTYFAIVTIAVAYVALIWAPQTVYEIYRYRKLKYLLKLSPVPYKKIIKRFAVSLPQYSEFKIAPTKEKASISFMMLWISLSVYILGFFVLLRIADIEAAVALPVLTLAALTWGIPLAIIIRLIGNYAVRKLFWEQVNPLSLQKADTSLMLSTEITANKKTTFRLRVFAVCQMFFELFIFLYLFDKIEIAGLFIGAGCSVAVGIILIFVTALIKSRTRQEDENSIYYTFTE